MDRDFKAAVKLSIVLPLLAMIAIGGGLTWDSFIPLYFVLWILCAYFYRLLLKNID